MAKAKKRTSKPKNVRPKAVKAKAVKAKEPNTAQKKYTLTKNGLYTAVKNSVRVFLTQKEYDKLKQENKCQIQ